MSTRPPGVDPLAPRKADPRVVAHPAAQSAVRPADGAGAAAGAAVGTCAVHTFIFVCHGPSCSERGSPAVLGALRDLIANSPQRAGFAACETSCLDHCATGPNVLISSAHDVQTGVQPAAAQDLLDLLCGPPRAEG